MKMRWRRAYARLLKVVTGDVGPCQMPDCEQRATVIVEWDVPQFGTMRAWYCDEHTPEEAVEA